MFRDVPGTVPESDGTRGFRRISSRLDRAPKTRDCLRLSSWYSFSVTVPSISYETWVMYSSVIPGMNVFCDRLFLVISCVSPETAANFRLFLCVAILLEEGKKLNICVDWFIFISRFISWSWKNITFLFSGELFSDQRQLTELQNWKTASAIQNINNISTFVIYLFFCGKLKCLHAKSRYKQGKVL